MHALRFQLFLAIVLWPCLSWSPVFAADPSTNQPTGLLRGTITEADTGRLAPCDVTIIDAAGRTVRDKASFQAGFRCDGRFARQLPAGKTRIRVWRGFETRAEEREIDLPAGRETEVQFQLRRIVDLRRRGWFAGDSHAHMIHGEKTIPVDFDDVALAAQAEDLQYLSLAQAWTLANPTPEALAAALDPQSKPDCVVTWNLEAPKNYYRGDAGRCLGHCWNLGLRGRTPAGEDVIRLLLQASAQDYESDKPSFANFESHQLIHIQGGTVFYSHPARWWTGPWGGQGGYPKRESQRVSNMAVELPLDTLLGPTFDGVDVMTGTGEFKANAMAFELWCLLLNHGYRVAATASSDSCFDRPGGAVPGGVRTYTYLEEPFSMPAVARATAQGKTFVTSGPLLLARVDGKPPGIALAADGQPRTLAIEAWASGTDPKGLTRLEVLRNGKLFQAITNPPALALRTNLALRETGDAWYCVRVSGGDPQRQLAISGAFFFDTPNRRPPAAVPARVQVTLADARTGEKLSGTLMEVMYRGPLADPGRKHAIEKGEALVVVPGTVRLLAEAPGYEPLTLSPFLDHPPLLEFITLLQAEALVDWQTYERVRELLNNVRLDFRLQKRTANPKSEIRNPK